MKNNLCFDNYSLVELRKISEEVEALINEKTREEEQEAWKELKQAYKEFRVKMPHAKMFVDFECDCCEYSCDVEIFEELDNYWL